MLILKVMKAYHVEPLAHRQTFVTTLWLEDVFGARGLVKLVFCLM